MDKDNKNIKGNQKENPLSQILDKLEKGLTDLFESETYKKYLSTMGKFHNYSFNNTLLIAMQKPDATLVAGYTSWQRNFKRQVNHGEKGIKILAPAPYKKKELRDVVDPATKKPIIGSAGKPRQEEVEVTIPAFRPVTVFDYAQTSGEEIPQLGVSELTFSVENFVDYVEAIKSVCPVPVEFADIKGGAKGYFSPTEQKVVVQENMSEAQTVKTLLHECAHALAHDKENLRIEGLTKPTELTKQDIEVTAESVAFAVASRIGGIDTSDYSFGYIAGWSSGKEMKELKGCMEDITKIASTMITGIEVKLAQIKREREAEMENTAKAPEIIGTEPPKEDKTITAPVVKTTDKDIKAVAGAVAITAASKTVDKSKRTSVKKKLKEKQEIIANGDSKKQKTATKTKGKEPR